MRSACSIIVLLCGCARELTAEEAAVRNDLCGWLRERSSEVCSADASSCVDVACSVDANSSAAACFPQGRAMASPDALAEGAQLCEAPGDATFVEAECTDRHDTAEPEDFVVGCVVAHYR
jgi:hypothetical protein